MFHTKHTHIHTHAHTHTHTHTHHTHKHTHIHTHALDWTKVWLLIHVGGQMCGFKLRREGKIQIFTSSTISILYWTKVWLIIHVSPRECVCILT